MSKKQIIVIGVKLCVICLFAAAALALVNNITYPKIQESKRQAVLNALAVINKAGTIGDQVAVNDGLVNYYHPVTDNGKVANYILSINGEGYAGNMIILANFKADGDLIDAKLMDNTETPGLGKRAEEDWYMEKFKGFGAKSPIPTKKGMLQQADADIIGGSTITFAGIAKALENGSEYVKKLGGQK